MKVSQLISTFSLCVFAAACSSTFHFREEGPTPPLIGTKSTQATEEITPLTLNSFAESDEYSPAIVSDSLVAFVSDRSRQLDIWYVKHNDTNRPENAELVATDADEKAPFILPDAALKRARCYFVTDASGLFQVFSGALPRVTIQTSELTSLGEANWPDVSSDSKRLLYSVTNAARRYEVWMLDLDTGRTTRIGPGQRARWKPGSSTEFAYTVEENGTWSIKLKNLSSNSLNVNLQQGAGDSFDPAWSADGQFIAYTSNRTGSSDIWIMNADGSNARQKTTHGAIDCQPVWTADGKSLIFASNRSPSGHFDVYKMSVEDVLATDVTP